MNPSSYRTRYRAGDARPSADAPPPLAEAGPVLPAAKGEPLPRPAAGKPEKVADTAKPKSAQPGSPRPPATPRPSRAQRAAKGHIPSSLPPLSAGSRAALAQRRRRRTRRKILRAALRSLGVLGLTLTMTLVLALGAITIICKGPFPTAKELFVVSVNETSAIKFLSRLYFSQEEVADILARNAIVVPNQVTDTTQPFASPPTQEDAPPLVIEDVYGSTYKGKMMIVQDPSRIRLGTLPAFGAELRGMRIEQFAEEFGAVGAINAGGFVDEGGLGKGGLPLGLLIHEGKIMSGSVDTACNIIGFDQNHRLVVGEMTGQQALDMGVRDAVHFSPTLIVNGTPAEVDGTGGGLNPRTVIGQRADGTVLLLVIDGRQPHSVGATLQDCLQEMLNYGAVNAANLDGGSSSMMVYEGEVINTCASLNGSRSQPAAWLVM